MRYGVQGFGSLKNSELGVPELLTKVREAGYQLFEPCITFFPIPGLEKMAWDYDRYDYYAGLMKKSGLQAVSCHVFSQDLYADGPKMAQLAADYGIEQFVLKSPQDLSDESLQQTAMVYMRLADMLEPVNARVLIHNEAADIETKVHGKTAYEYLLDLCLGKVDAQIDAGWAMYGGEDPVKLLWRNAYRIKSLHLKDFSGKTEVEIGKGDLDLEGCFQFARAMGIPQICDQDSFTGSVTEELKSVCGRLENCSQGRSHSVSYLNVYNIETGEIRVLRKFDRVIEAPNWRHTAPEMVYNSEGRIYRYNYETDTEQMLDTGICVDCNNDHVLSPDEKYIAVSNSAFTPEEGFTSRIYIVPMEGGEARLVTPNSASFLHGWSPDGKTLAYCAFRMQDTGFEVDVYGISAEGGEEWRITDGGFNDGPEFSPDGKQIWFNSTRSGLMQAYCMNADGSGRTQVTKNERNNWFPHISPDGKKVVYLSYRKGDLDAGEHLPNMQVELWLMNSNGTDQHRILSFFGGQGSINVNSWSADSKEFAFVSYELLHD